MKLQLHNITSKINENKIEPVLDYNESRKKVFITVINYNLNKALP